MSNHLLQPINNQTLAYTDGACRGNPGRAGFGAVLILPTGEQIDIWGGEENSTNNRMELMGAIVAIEHSPKDIPLQIWTDSNYVKQGITQWIQGWKQKNWKNIKNIDLWQRLDKACHQRQIDWQWLKGHAGHVGNEYADKLANQGIDDLPKTFQKKIHSLLTTKPVTDTMKHIDNIEEIIFFDDVMIDEPNLEENHFLELPIDNNQPKDNTDDEIMQTPQTNEQLLGFIDSSGYYLPQTDDMIAKRPVFNGNTQQKNSTFVPLLPIAKHHLANNRQLILDTETTGLDVTNGDRIIEVGIVELINRRFTGEKLHVYINPERTMSEDAIKIHGITEEFLADMPTFAQVGQIIYDFLIGAELIAHNANFDMGFLQAEFERLGLPDISEKVTVTDSLAIAKQQYAGQRNTLDALVKRLNVGKQDRTFHGALLDAEILADVYLAMTGGQVSLAIDDDIIGATGIIEHLHFKQKTKRFVASEASEQAHLDWLNSLKDNYPQLVENWNS